MSYEHAIYSPESAADCWPTSFSDTSQLSLLSGNHTPAKSYANEPPKDGSPNCTCGKEISDCSIHPSTPEKWIASMRDSLAKTLALLESRQVYLREPDQGFTEKSCALLTRYDRNSSSWKTLQQSFLTDSEPFLETWPRRGMTQGGVAYAHPMSERRITGTDGFCWPTPNVPNGGRSCAHVTEWSESGKTAYHNGKKVQIGLEHAVKHWTTPCADDTGHRTAKYAQGGTALSMQAGGKLNPNWVGWLMGFPIGWANSKATEMPRCHYRQQPHGDCSEVAK